MTSSSGWIPVVASQLLEPGKVMPVVVAGAEVAVWRAVGGRAHAWVDRCPHRGMRLSLGAVAGESLICPYHGWRFGADARCEQMPAHPQTLPAKAARARPFQTREGDGFVWMSMASGADSEGAPPHVAAPTGGHPLRSLTMPGSRADVAAALMILPLAPDDEGPWRDWRWRRSGGDLHVEAHRDGQSYRAALRAEARIDAVWTAGSRELRYGFDLVDAAHGATTVHVRAGPEATQVEQFAFLARFAAARQWMALHPHDGDWAAARASMRTHLPLNEEQGA